jgi:tRNA-Thr(GGU) m(6)t(6)A37 methyltransferase TsaA
MTGSNLHTTIIVLSSSCFLAIGAYSYHKKKLQEVTSKLTRLREAERKGRIKAEIQVRSAIKNDEDKRIAASSAFNAQEGDVEENPLLLRCIGTIVSPFTKRMGTPRQGALAPHAKGYVDLNASIAPMETLSGIENYSHAWIIFTFHANTDVQSRSVKTKVKPPRAGGIKVGSMATRSPHRPNNIGLSLVKITGIDHKKKRLHIAALDLVNGTPVYDIKPVVPWDIPGHFDAEELIVPSWVSQDDALSKVSFTTEAEDQLNFLVKRLKLAPLYRIEDLDDAKLAVKEILSQDPRAAKSRGKVGIVSDPYTVTFGQILIYFVVVKKGSVQVVGMKELKLDDATFVDGIPLAHDGTMS